MKDYCPWCHQTEEWVPPGLPAGPLAREHFTCPGCRRPVTLISIRRAATLLGICRKTVHRWISAGRVSAVRGPNGRYLVCYSSLFCPDLDQGR
jgi:excisionase family DNA binding protein